MIIFAIFAVLFFVLVVMHYKKGFRNRIRAAVLRKEFRALHFNDPDYARKASEILSRLSRLDQRENGED
jgi:hypothetical protein